jgi:hypothetical protein
VSASPFHSAAARIVWDVAIYRLRKREAGNLATSLTLAWALAAPPAMLVERAVFGAVLNLFVYLVNDCFDVAIDLAAPGRDTERTRFLAANLRAAWVTVGLLGFGLVLGGALVGGGLALTAAVNIAVIFAYSRVLKHRALWDLLAMGVWGVSMAMVGFDPHDPRGWRLAALLGLLSMVTESVQVLRDQPSDAAAGVRTTAVVLGRVDDGVDGAGLRAGGGGLRGVGDSPRGGRARAGGAGEAHAGDGESRVGSAPGALRRDVVGADGARALGLRAAGVWGMGSRGGRIRATSSYQTLTFGAARHRGRGRSHVSLPRNGIETLHLPWSNPEQVSESLGSRVVQGLAQTLL